jgi:hypothetical protein
MCMPTEKQIQRESGRLLQIHPFVPVSAHHTNLYASPARSQQRDRICLPWLALIVSVRVRVRMRAYIILCLCMCPHFLPRSFFRSCR